ncbi:4-fold beta flower protein [uncultured Psychromonas sp.]|uniref:4-fold beta flower protein n=1 Tax=uncultured Psychromonas sp. TaxID=173974 RepID=UPI0026331796|nr:hypothetical protein [uncultured Psychromonas sp.]
MSLDFFDSSGQPYAYCDDGDTIFTFGGAPIAFIDGDSIYSFSGAHLGFFENGNIWDHRGGVVLFTQGSSGGPMKPLQALKPLKGLKSLKPLKGLKSLKPLKALKSMNWSSISPQQLFEV